MTAKEIEEHVEALIRNVESKGSELDEAIRRLWYGRKLLSQARLEELYEELTDAKGGTDEGGN